LTTFEVEILYLLTLGERRQRLFDDDFTRHLRDDDGKLIPKLIPRLRDEG